MYVFLYKTSYSSRYDQNITLFAGIEMHAHSLLVVDSLEIKYEPSNKNSFIIAMITLFWYTKYTTHCGDFVCFYAGFALPWPAFFMLK